MHTAIRDDTRELEVLISQLAEQAGSRFATSPGEATAAAFVNGRLRRAGMGVGTYELRAARRPGGAYVILGILGVLAAVLTPVFALPSLLLALNVLAFLAADGLWSPIPPVGRRRASQNIIGTRAVEGAAGLVSLAPRWRIVLLAPLDAPVRRTGLAALAGPGRKAKLARLAATALVAAGAATALWVPGPFWLVGLPGGLGCLLLALAAMLPVSPDPADGGLAALATLLAVAQRIERLGRVELWAVAVGAAAIDPRGVTTLLPRFPFDRRSTLFIALEQLSGSQVVYATSEGDGGAGDPLLLRLAAAVDSADAQIDAEPRPLGKAGLLAAPLRRHGYRALTILARPTPGASAAASGPSIDSRLVERATRLVVGIIRQLDAEGDVEGQ